MITNRLRASAQQNRDRIACDNGRERITYGELIDRAEDAAVHLRRQGSTPVILYGHKEISMVVALTACLLAGRTYVPVDRTYITPEHTGRLRNIIRLSGAGLLLREDATDFPDIECRSLNDLPFCPAAESYTPPDDIVYMMFTSGTTGEPKGVPISKTNLESFINWLARLPPLSEYRNIAVLNQASFGFDLSVADLFYSLCGGHTLILLDRTVQESYDGIFRLLSEKQVGLCVVTPTFLKLCLLNDGFRAENFPFLNCVYCCGEPLEPKTVRKFYDRFPSAAVINAYGPTEAACAVSGIVITREMLDEPLLPVGETGHFAADIAIEDGEIVLRGDSVFGGYLGNLPGGHFTENGGNGYRTGDLGFLENGKLYCRGRKDTQIKYKGFRIELTDIEHNLAALPGVRECAVIAKYAGSAVKTIQAFAVWDGEGEPDAARLREELKQRLPDYMIPKTIRFIDRLPVSANGKTDRKALSEL